MSLSMRYGNIGKTDKTSKVSLLWENDDVSASFGAQTIDLSDGIKGFDFILVTYFFSTSTQNTWSQIYPASDVASGNCVLPINDINNHTGRRLFVASTDTAIAFSSATFGGSTANNQIVPAGIYGIKL